MRGESTFRWLDAVRYAVATVVTVLVVAVIVNAIKVVLRPDSPCLWVVQGSVYTTPEPAQKMVTLGLNLRTENPSGRSRIYVLSISVYLFNNKTVESTTTDPEGDCIIFFPTKDVAVAQQAAVDSITQVPVTSDDSGAMDSSYFQMLYAERGVIRDAAMRVKGTLVTEVRSGINRTRPETIYHCWPLVIGGSPSDKASSGRQDTRCMERVQTYSQLDE